MGCPKTTPADSPHEVHAGLKVGPGAFLNERVLCIHADGEGVGVPAATVTLEPQFAEGIQYAAETHAFEEDAPADLPTAPRRRKAK